ncbi:MAG: hypothetical protein ACJAZS_000761 [Alteromonas naphthalenivorans]|jgi:hypothetical protein
MKRYINTLALSVLLLQISSTHTAAPDGYCYGEQPDQNTIDVITPTLGMFAGSFVGGVIGSLRLNDTVEKIQQRVERLENDIYNCENGRRDNTGTLEWDILQSSRAKVWKRLKKTDAGIPGEWELDNNFLVEEIDNPKCRLYEEYDIIRAQERIITSDESQNPEICYLNDDGKITVESGYTYRTCSELKKYTKSMSITEATQLLLLQTHKPVNVDIVLKDIADYFEKYPIQSLRGPAGKDAYFDAKAVAAALLENPEFKKEIVAQFTQQTISDEIVGKAVQESKWGMALQQGLDDLTTKVDTAISTLEDKIRVGKDWQAQMQAQIDLRRASSVSQEVSESDEVANTSLFH